MKPPSLLVVGAVLCTAGLLSLTAQQPGVLAPSPRQRVITSPGGGDPQRAPLVLLLSRNYLLKLAIAEGERVTECRLVTAASQISVSTAPGGDGVRPLSVNGLMEELEDGGVGISLSVSAFVGENAVASSQPRSPGQSGVNESFTASLRAKPGVEYPLFTTGARTYRLTITAHEEQGAVPAK